MNFLALLAALLLEQVRPLQDRGQLGRSLDVMLDIVERHFNAGERHHGLTAWLVTVLPVIALSLLVYYLSYQVSAILALAWNVAILYLTMGFRQFSHHFTDIHRALAAGDVEQARRLIGAWSGRTTDTLNSSEIARLAIEEALTASHHHVFAVLFWFVLLPGPAGALLYRLSFLLKIKWGGKTGPVHGGFGHFANRASYWLNWLPLRLTAVGFAVAGNFEDAIYCWRNQAARWRDPELGIVLASGAGAIGVKLGMPVPKGAMTQDSAFDDRVEIGTGIDADAAFLSSTVGLVWRALVLWMLLLAMLAVASWV